MRFRGMRRCMGFPFVGPLAVVALCMPQTAIAQPVPGATYTGPVLGGIAYAGPFPAIRFQTDSTGTMIASLTVSYLGCITPDGTSVTASLTAPIPIINVNFDASGDALLSGSFTGPQQASGTVSESNAQCTTGPLYWTASTTALPPPPTTPTTPHPPAAPNSYRVPILRGKTLSQARALLKAHFKLGKVHRTKGSGVPVGKILRASPAGGTTQKAGTAINLWIRNG